jgi:hypothetical protein
VAVADGVDDGVAPPFELDVEGVASPSLDELVLDPLLDGESDELGGVLVDDGVLFEPLRLSLR